MKNNQNDGVNQSAYFLRANWAAPKNVHTLMTTRQGGISEGVYASLNLGAHVGDCAESVAHNRAIVQKAVALPMVYLNQVHGHRVIAAKDGLSVLQDADASVDNTGTVACAVMTADCLPVLFCDVSGSVVAAAHAGWRGLASGVLQNTVAAMNVQPEKIMAYLAPAIGAKHFEVGQDVFDAFCQNRPQAKNAFFPLDKQKYLADIYALARQVLNEIGVEQISGGEYCTFSSPERFFSYRRDGQTGRMVNVIWLEK